MRSIYIMKILLLCICAVISIVGTDGRVKTTTPPPPLSPAEMEAKIKSLESNVQSLTKQIMENELFAGERIRSSGMSGMKRVRHYHEGTRPWFGDSHIGGAAEASHDHANYDRTIGLGELLAVMNGVEFRTRHNDYKLRRPSTTSSDFHFTEDIKMPDVPPEVLNKPTVKEQIEEMQLWFKAFKDQDHSVRDYRKYFKANLCIMEGTWTLDTNTLQEPFHSDRHHIAAKSWEDLQQQIRFTSFTGSKSNMENLSYLPRIIYNISADGTPQFAQWNYRIICHPVSFDVPTSYFKVQDDLAYRMAHRWGFDRVVQSRAARFKLNEFGFDRFTHFTMLDKMMGEFPGLDNYGANITDESFNQNKIDISQDGDKILNVANYHRWYKYLEHGAMGESINHRGFSDENMWVALNTRQRVMPVSLHYCNRKTRTCSDFTQKLSYAFPLEIVYTTPLFNWNPYNITFRAGDYHKDPEALKVTANGRNGSNTPSLALDGNNLGNFYRTPEEFYQVKVVEHDRADTARKSLSVLDPHGVIRQLSPSGTRIVTPEIGGDVGKLRLRYPIFPVHSEGTTVGAELAALKEAIMNMPQYHPLFETDPHLQKPDKEGPIHFLTDHSHSTPEQFHGHEFTISSSEHKLLLDGGNVTVVTSQAVGHTHTMVIKYDRCRDVYRYILCDGQKHCWDNHYPRVFRDYEPNL